MRDDFSIYGGFNFIFDVDVREVNRIHRGKGKIISQTVRQKQLEFAMTRDILGKYANFEVLTRSRVFFRLACLALPTPVAQT